MQTEMDEHQQILENDDYLGNARGSNDKSRIVTQRRVLRLPAVELGKLVERRVGWVKGFGIL